MGLFNFFFPVPNLIASCWAASGILTPCVLSHFCHAWLFVTPWIVVHQAPLSMVFSRQEYLSGLPFPSLGDLPNPGTKPMYFVSPALPGGFFITSTNWEAIFTTQKLSKATNQGFFVFSGDPVVKHLPAHCCFNWRLSQRISELRSRIKETN